MPGKRERKEPSPRGRLTARPTAPKQPAPAGLEPLAFGQDVALRLAVEQAVLVLHADETRRAVARCLVRLEDPSEGRIVFGEMDGRVSDRATRLRDVLARAGVPVELATDIRRVLWEKYLLISAQAGMTGWKAPRATAVSAI